jgi:ankyrin repeat protein
MVAASGGCNKIAELLLAAGANTEIVNAEDGTALIIAA